MFLEGSGQVNEVLKVRLMCNELIVFEYRRMKHGNDLNFYFVHNHMLRVFSIKGNDENAKLSNG